jgi:predicted NACHT family NTPase
MTRSFRASEAGLKQAEAAFKLKGWTQEYLAGGAKCTRQVVINFFARRPVATKIFKAICQELGLEWGEIVELKSGEENLASPKSLDELVNQVREKVKQDIQTRCGSMRVLDMTRPIGLSDIYTEVNILEKILGRRQLKIAQLLEGCNQEDFDRFGLGQVTEERVPGLDAVKKYSKLMILGKPGAGKSTFLKRVATQCNKGEFLATCVPVFITLKDFAEAPQQPGLWQYIINGLIENEILYSEKTAKILLREGRAILLLDGLDEVRQADNDRVLKEIRNFSARFNANYFIITCRIAAKEYTFEQFTEVEVADFDDQQIQQFVTNWFQVQNPKKALQFIEKLEENERIKELATNPLLLTLLCLLFGESTDFPANRSELYEQGLDVLLRKWDGTRGIERDQAYRQLSLKRKEDLLGQIALTTFEQGNYFFKQRQAQQYITDYIQNLPDAPTNLEALELDSRAVLKSIEAQHGLLIERARGIYSFSHLTFHEFFTARNFALSRHSQQAFQQLVRHMNDKSWREVFLLTVGILPNADDLLQLMKPHVDALLAEDEKLQQFLHWVDEKSYSIEAPYKPAAVRAFYFSRSLDLALNLAFNHALEIDYDLDGDITVALEIDHLLEIDRDIDLEIEIDHLLEIDRDIDLEIEIDRDLYRALYRDLDLNRALALDALDRNLESDCALALTPALDRILGRALALALDRNLNSKLQDELRQLEAYLWDAWDNKREKFQSWWQANGQAWTEQLRAVIIEHRNIGHDWQFNDSQKKLLQQYYNANKLLVDCLNSDCYVSREVRQEIEDTLLLPVNIP